MVDLVLEEPASVVQGQTCSVLGTQRSSGS